MSFTWTEFKIIQTTMSDGNYEHQEINGTQHFISVISQRTLWPCCKLFACVVRMLDTEAMRCQVHTVLLQAAIRLHVNNWPQSPWCTISRRNRRVLPDIHRDIVLRIICDTTAAAALVVVVVVLLLLIIVVVLLLLVVVLHHYEAIQQGKWNLRYDRILSNVSSVTRQTV